MTEVIGFGHIERSLVFVADITKAEAGVALETRIFFTASLDGQYALKKLKYKSSGGEVPYESQIGTPGQDAMLSRCANHCGSGLHTVASTSTPTRGSRGSGIHV